MEELGKEFLRFATGETSGFLMSCHEVGRRCHPECLSIAAAQCRLVILGTTQSFIISSQWSICNS